MRVAAIDIGTNSVLLLVAERRGNEIVRVRDLATITRLGEGVDATGRLSPAAVERTLACLERYAALIHSDAVARVGAVGTSASRDAAGGSDFVARARAVLGVTPAIISGDREAELTFRGALSGLPLEGPVAVFDIGGGSTEIILGDATTDGGVIRRAISLDVGSVRLTERHVRHDPPTSDELTAVRADVVDALTRAPTIRDVPLVGVAGTITTLVAVRDGLVSYDGDLVHGSTLTRSDLAALTARFVGCPLEARRALPGLSPKRADVIVAGTIIADAVCAHADAAELTVSDGGVRWGLALELLAPNEAHRHQAS